MEKRALEVLQGKLEKIKASSLDPGWLGGELRAAGIIEPGDETRARNESIDRATRAGELVGKVQSSSREGAFQKFVAMLLKEPKMAQLAHDLKGRVVLCADSGHFRYIVALGRTFLSV